MPLAMPDPALTTLTVNGSVVPSGSYHLSELEPHVRNGVPSAKWAVRGGGFRPVPDPWLYKECTLAIDLGDGRGSVVYFRGDVVDLSPRNSPLGYFWEYLALGLRNRGDRVPVRDDSTGNQSVVFNQSIQNLAVASTVLARAGRTVGQAILEYLSMDAQVSFLGGRGIGAYVTTGTGATAHATLSGTTVATIPVDSGGTGYATAPTVVLIGTGTGATATAHVTAGAVTSISVTTAGTGYLAPPVVVISRLPAITITELLAIDHLPPHPLPLRGERSLSAIEGLLSSSAPNVSMYIDHDDGTLRFHDLRTFGTTTATVAASPAGAVGTATVAPVVYRGKVVAVQVMDGGFGYVGTPAITIAGLGGGAAATATVVGGQVVSASVTTQGSGYGGPLVNFTIDKDIFKPLLRRDTRGCYPRFVVRGDTFNEGKEVWLSKGDISKAFGHDGMSSAEAEADWNPTDFNEPSLAAGPGTRATGTANRTGATVTSISIINAGLGYGRAPTIAFSGGGGTGARAHAVIDATGAVTSTVIDNVGSGYTSNPTVTFSPPITVNSDFGTCTCPSTTTVTVTSADPKKNWATNELDYTSTGRHAVVTLSSSTAGNVIDQKVTRRVIANTSKAAGGTSTLTLDIPIDNTKAYDTYSIYMMNGGSTVVGRLFTVNNPAFAHAMQGHMTYPVNFYSYSQNAVVPVTTPVASILWSANGLPPYQERPWGFTFDPDAGTILFDRPIYYAFGDGSRDTSGNLSIQPSDIKVMLAVATSRLEVQSPADIAGVPQFAGTIHSVEGSTDTKYAEILDWVDPSNQANMQAYADQMLDCQKNTNVEGPVPYDGVFGPALYPGLACNVKSDTETTGYEAINAPIVACRLSYQTGPGALAHSTEMQASTRRTPYGGADFLAPAQQYHPIGLADGGEFFAGAPAVQAENTYGDGVGDLGFGVDPARFSGESPIKARWTYGDQSEA